jgi:pyrimidine oxygenase
MDIGIFLPTGRRGYLISKTAPLNEPTFELNRFVVEAAERYGCEFALSMVKFRGFGGESQFWEGSLEPFTLISALAAVTKRIKLFATAASLAIPPAVAAQMATTVDSIAPGRFGINVVTGWQKAEYEQMGLWPGDNHYQHRYDYLAEYVAVMKDLWREGRSVHSGEFFKMHDCRLGSTPANPIELVVAGGSDAGLAFAAQHCDYTFCAPAATINDPASCREPIERLRRAAERTGRGVRALVWFSVIAAATDEEAIARWNLVREGADLEAMGWSATQAAADRLNADPNSTAGKFAKLALPLPTTAPMLVGSYASVARMLDEIAEVQGMTGCMLSFDDFRVGIMDFGERIQPLMRCRAGVRSRVAAAA